MGGLKKKFSVFESLRPAFAGEMSRNEAEGELGRYLSP
jgi:hypothetical protein